ncbi:MAG TPA: hypothetical protein VGJ37_19505 [Pyrinomonadaceae bacterium]
MIPRLNISAGEFFDLIRPAVILISALLSTWVLASARKRFSIYAAFAWAVGTLFLPLIVLPVYLSVILLWPRPVRSRRWRLLLPIAYGVIVIAAISAYFYLDSQSVDAHLARATRAKVTEDHATVIREYRRALALEDDPHTHKLLALELAQTGDLNEAVSEFRLARQGGEPDDLIAYEVGLLFQRLKHNDEAKLEFERFVLSDTCKRIEEKCDDARDRIRQLSQ